MPQYLRIEAAGALVGKMSTSHRPETDTCYDVSWQEPGGVELFLPNVDTGIPRQPSDCIEKQRDFRNDFTHARRSVGAAVVTAPRFLEQLALTETEGERSTEGVLIRLSTNLVDRGMISIQRQQGGRADVKVRIGTGPNRAEDAYPPDVVEFACQDIDTAGVASPLALAVQVLASAGPRLLRMLDEGA